MQRAQKVVSDSPGLVDFGTGLVNTVQDNQLDGQGKFSGGVQIIEELQSILLVKNLFQTS